jgi:hypothetical protein
MADRKSEAVMTAHRHDTPHEQLLGMMFQELLKARDHYISLLKERDRLRRELIYTKARMDLLEEFTKREAEMRMKDL